MVGLFVYKNDYLLFFSGNDRYMNIYNWFVFLIVMEKLQKNKKIVLDEGK